MQGNWIANLMDFMREKGLKTVDVEKESEDAWAKGVRDIAYSSLLPTTKSVSPLALSK